MEWNPEAIAQLKALRAAGMSFSEIGGRLRCSKAAIAGKVHRLKLEGRPGPSQTRNSSSGRGLPPSAGRRVVPSAPLLGSGQAVVRDSVLPMAAAGTIPGGHVGAASVFSRAEAAPAPPHKLLSPYRECRMPLWPNSARRDHADFGRFCAAPVVQGTSWCPRCKHVVAA